MADDHVAAKIGSVETDPLGRLLQHTTLTFALSAIWLQMALQRTIEVHAATPEHFVAWANRGALFEDVTRLIEGVSAWYEGDLVKAVHVLVPQIERGLRGIVAKLGKPVTKSRPTDVDVGVAFGMGDILYSEELTQALGPDLTLYFLALYADPRGRNLRNRVAHGLIEPELCDGNLVRLLIHTLLVFGFWKELAEKRRYRRPHAAYWPLNFALALRPPTNLQSDTPPNALPFLYSITSFMLYKEEAGEVLPDGSRSHHPDGRDSAAAGADTRRYRGATDGDRRPGRARWPPLHRIFHRQHPQP